jgi:hypothetical protein
MRLTEEELIRELHEERPQVDPEFAKALDQWAAAGFARGGPDGGPRRRGRWSRVTQGIEGARRRIAATPPRRLIAPVGAAATLVVVAGIALSQSGGAPDQTTVSPTAEPLEDLSVGPESAPPGDAGIGETTAPDAAPLAPDTGGANDDVANRRAGGDAEIARDARLVLGSEPDEVQEVADGVNEVTNRHRGYVVNSEVESGEDSLTAGASFRLRIPAQNLQPALADLSELAHVESRNEGTLDITGRFVSAENAIERLERSVDAAEAELATAEGRERRKLEREIENLEARLAAEQRSLARAEQRVDLVPVDVEIVTGQGSGDWGLEEALEDAGDVLSTLGGGLVVAGAVIAPFALLGGIAYAINRRRVRAARDRALD